MPRVRSQGDLNTTVGIPRETRSRTPNQPAPWTVGPNAGQGDARAPYSNTDQLIVRNPDGSPQINSGGAPAPTGPTDGYYVTDPQGNFLSGNPVDYANGYAGAYPGGAAGSYQDALSLAATQAAQNNNAASQAGFDLSQNNLQTSFSELMGLLGRNKGKSLGSLADSMADRGLTNSGIFLKSTGDVENNYGEQIASNTRNRDSQLSEIARQRLNSENAMQQAIAQAQQDAMQRAIDAWTQRYEAGKRIATDRIAAGGQ